MSEATLALSAALTALTSSVNALIAASAAPREDTAGLTAATDQVNALRSLVDAALAPPPPPPVA